MPLSFATRPLIAEKRSITYSIIGGIWLLVTLYAIAHDQYIVRIAPEHFTLYHAPIWGLQHPHAIAAAWAFKAAVLPGFLLGIASAAVARHGRWPKLSPLFILTGTLLVIALTELVSCSIGLWTRNTGAPLFPDSFYPSHQLPLLITQSIQLCCYLAAAFFSTLWLITMAILRYRRSR